MDPGQGPGCTKPARLPLSLRGLLAASLLVPLLFLAGGAWFDHHRLMTQAYGDVGRLSAVAREHALKVVETNALVLDRVEDRVRGLGREEIAAQGEAIHRHMRALEEPHDQITALHLVDAEGRLLVISLAWPTPEANLAGRDYFQRTAAGERGLVFGAPALGRVSGRVAFVMARRREAEDGRFEGLVLGSILPSYLQRQWHTMDPEGRARFTLLRTDGQALATHPRGDSDLIPPPDPAAVPRGVREAGEAAHVERLGERGEWITAFRRVGDYPLVVGVSLSRDRIRAEWLANLAFTGLLCLLASGALGGVSLLAARRWRSEQAMRDRLSGALAELREQVARREAAEAGLRQAQRLEALGRLTGGIAHDFNNLLTAILGTVQMLERHLGPAADERVRRLLGIARDAVDRGARLNASLLAFARRQPLHATALDANALVRGFAPLIQRALGEVATLALDLAPDLPPCRADAAQLEAALLNLAINARDAMPQGGQVRLTSRLVRLGPEELAGNAEARPGAYVALALADSGIGMPPEVRERAFEPFFTTKPVGKGTGLGLSQVFGFVRQLGGHVAIESAPGDGTRVTLYLPVSAAPAAAAPAPPAPGGALPPARGRVLMAEDDERVRTVMAEALRQAGLEVIAVPDGQAALAVLVRGERVDVLFSDIVMPGGLSGIGLAEAARQLRPGLPVLLATGYAGLAADGEEHGFAVLAKPYDQAVLLARLRALLERRAEEVG
ncbi:hybrid sensor histidine kinase/response regulator [Crenalkalicoccus roseus]|uniref:hybrid sensor histidine kinase/response regulator n=1 Tax=Crenalkalicoccus roseus TaxID=1485588 RepID=UPI001080A35A|nr:ATP-binding protein [Crenalkalicoccus roseus]